MSTRLLNEELMKKEKGESQEGEEVAILMTRRSNSQCGKDWSKNICNYCKEQGHWTKDCHNRKDQQEKKEQGNNADYGEVLTFISALSISSHDDAWYINSGASMHLSHK